MEEWQKRVITEHKELGVKLRSICEYISTPAFSNLPILSMNMLAQQESFMQKYLGVLSARIALFKEN